MSASSYCSLVNVSNRKIEEDLNVNTTHISEAASSSNASNCSLSNYDDDENISSYNLTDDEACSEESETNFVKKSHGKLVLSEQNLKRIIRCGGKFPNGQPRIRPNLIELLKHRQVNLLFNYIIRF